MLNAIRYNKIPRALYKDNEDSLTSTVFEKLLYLPVEVFRETLTKSVIGDLSAFHFSKIEDFEFWPKWSADRSGNENYVEPDVFIRFECFDLIVEAKRHGGSKQHFQQWCNEIQAYRNEYGKDEKELVFLALEGIIDEEVMKEKKVDDCKVKIYTSKWSYFLQTIKQLNESLDHSEYLTSANMANKRIFDDLIESFALYGFFTGEWFEKFYLPGIVNDQTLSNLQNLWKDPRKWTREALTQY